MTRIEQLFFELLQISLENREKFSENPSAKDWAALYEMAEWQAVVGVFFKGIERLPAIQMPPVAIKLRWIGLLHVITVRSRLLDKQTAVIWQQLKDAGLDAVVLKGQGIACEYGELATFRQCGDIDIWVKGGYQKVCDFVQRTAPTEDFTYHRFHYDKFTDTEVELHHRPTLMRNLLDDKKLSKWYNSFKAESFVYVKNKGFSIPSVEFNRIFLLTHIYRHFLFEGVGIRQVMDLYFVLQNSERNEDELEHLRDFRLIRFARAMMWLLHEQFRLKEEKLMACGMDEIEGRFLMHEIVQMGNFGYRDKRYRYRYKRWYKLRHHIDHGYHLLLHYPSEVFWTPIWLVYHKIWKWSKKRTLMRH